MRALVAELGLPERLRDLITGWRRSSPSASDPRATRETGGLNLLLPNALRTRCDRADERHLDPSPSAVAQMWPG